MVNVEQRNNVRVSGSGPATMIFAHGFGCDQSMWRFVAPRFADRYRVVLFDLVGNGNSDLRAFDREKYGSLQGYADDLVEVVEQFATGPLIFIGHSVGAMIGLLADLAMPGRFTAHIMVSPSPCYINDERGNDERGNDEGGNNGGGNDDDDSYVGGFTRADIDSLLDTLESNYLGWSSTMAPVIMGSDGQSELGAELTNSFCRTDPDMAKQFARVTFLSDCRAELPKLQTRTLILQCTDDLIAPVTVGEYMQRTLPHATLALIENTGHCPHMSAPTASSAAMDAFLSTLAHA